MPVDAVVGAALDEARRAGVSDALATRHRVRAVRFARRKGELESTTEATTQELSVRVWVDGRFGLASTTDLRPASLAPFVRHLVDLTRQLEQDPHRRLAEPAWMTPPDAPELDLWDPDVAGLTAADRLAWLAALAEPIESAPDLVSSGVGVATEDSAWSSASTNGFVGDARGTRCVASASVTLRTATDRRSEESNWHVSRHRVDQPDPGETARRALARARQRVVVAKGPTARTAMVVEPRAAGKLVEALLTGTDGRSFHQRRSFWLDRLGVPSLSTALRLTDEPWQRRGLASATFDHEGLALRPRVVIADGALRSLQLDATHARKLDRAPTGAATNLRVAPGRRSTAELVRAMGDGVLVTDWVGGNLSESTGDFSYGLRGFEVRGGEVGRALAEMNVSGNIVALFAGLVEVGDDPWVSAPLQTPGLWFEAVQFSGS